MPKPADSLMSYLRTMSGAWRNDPRDDAELLAHFAESRNEIAFATLVGRHGGLVWRTCRSILGNTSDAEDAFQITFLAMSRKVSRISIVNLAGWLHRVARQTALNFRVTVQRHQKQEQELRTIHRPEGKEEAGQTELYAAMDEELAGLPERLRVPLLLRYLEGKTLEEVARTVGCSRPALGKRLAKGEAVLRERLERRGLTLGALSVIALLGNADGSPPVPPGLVASTGRAAVAFRAGTLTGVKANAAQNLLQGLAIEGVKRTAWWLLLVSVGCLGVGGTGLVAWKMYENSKNAVTPTVPTTPATATPKLTVESRGKRTDPAVIITKFGEDDPPPVFSPNSMILATVAESVKEGWHEIQKPGMAAFRLWDAATGSPLGSLGIPPGTWGSGCWKAVWPAHDTFLAQGFYSPLSSIKDLPTPCMVRWSKLIPGRNTTRSDVFLGMDIIGLSPDGKIVARRSSSGVLELLETASSKEVVTFISHKITENNWGSFAFSADNKIIAARPLESSEQDPFITLWDVGTGHKLCSVHFPPESWNRLVGFSPDNRLVVTKDKKDFYESPCYTINFWEAASTGLRWHLPMPARCREANVAFSPDSRLMAVGCVVVMKKGFAKSISVWDLATGQEFQHFQEPQSNENFAPKLVFSPDGQRLAAAGMEDGKVLIWNVKRPPALMEASKPLDQMELQALNAALTDIDAEAAQRAIWKLRQVPEQAVPLVAEYLLSQHLPLKRDLKQVVREVTRLLVDLENDNFLIRMNAAKELDKKLEEDDLNESVAEKTLRQALKGKPSPELTSAIGQLLGKKMRKEGLSSELMLIVRKVEVLERINNGPARELLAKLAETSSRAKVRQEAKAALQRLTKSTLAPLTP